MLMKIIAATSIFLLTLVLARPSGGEEINTDLLIVGGTESGWAAAIQAARLGVKSITIVHDGEWIGGQFTEQGLACVDENKGVGKVGWGVDWHPMKRSFHRSGLFKELMDRIEAFNREKYGSKMPGRPYHGPSTFRPSEAEAIFRQMLKPHTDSGQVRLITGHFPLRADIDHSKSIPQLKGLWFAPLTRPSHVDLHVRANMTIDASDWGEAIQVAGAAFECGPDPRSRYGEPSAPATLEHNPPNEMNPITWAMVVADQGTDSAIPRPEHFDDRNYPRATHLSLAAFRDLKWDRTNPGLGAIPHWPATGNAAPRQLSVYTVRRLIDGETSRTRQTYILLNYMNGQDYPLERLPQRVVDQLEATEPGASQKNIVRMTRGQRQLIYHDAKQHALGVLYHLQNFVHTRAKDKTHSFRHFALSDEFNTPDQLPAKPYIREGLRLKAMYMMREQDGRNRDGKTKVAARERFAHVMYPDGIFAWQFHYDFHRTGRTYLRELGPNGPWIDYHKENRHTQFLSDRAVFPLRSLVPERMNGLLGAQKNLGYSSIVSAAIRLHDQCIAVGQTSAALAVTSLRSGRPPRDFIYHRTAIESVREAVCGEKTQGVPMLLWPFRDLSPEEPSFVAVNRLAALQLLPIGALEVDFNPKNIASEDWKIEIVKRTQRIKKKVSTDIPSFESNPTRGEFCIRWWQNIKDVAFEERVRATVTDADGDRIPDGDDPLPFTAGEEVRFEIAKKPVDRDGLLSRPANEFLKLFNFCGEGTPRTADYIDDHGLTFRETRGFGWRRDLSANHRRRNALDGVQRDTFLFTRTRDRWELNLPAGSYEITVCVGDSSHVQHQQTVIVEGRVAVDHRTTAAGEFYESELVVDVNDRRLTIEIGSGKEGSNTCLNWLAVRSSRR